MPKYLAVTTAMALIVAGVVLTAVMRMPRYTDAQLNLHFASVIAGQLCWAAAMFILLLRSDSYADEHLSYDGPAIPIFNTVKWGLVTLFLLFDAFLLERVWEWYFISN